MAIHRNTSILAARFFLAASLLIAPPAFSDDAPVQNAPGFNSTGPTLPLGANNAVLMDIYNDNNGTTGVGIGMGTSVPQAMLDVNGSIRPGSSGVKAGDVCATEGLIAYDLTSDTHQPVYCSSSKKWTAMFSGGACTVYLEVGGYSNRSWIDNPQGNWYGAITYTTASYPSGKTIFVESTSTNYDGYYRPRRIMDTGVYHGTDDTGYPMDFGYPIVTCINGSWQ